jgi:hypothetical protein
MLFIRELKESIDRFAVVDPLTALWESKALDLTGFSPLLKCGAGNAELFLKHASFDIHGLTNNKSHETNRVLN